MKKRMNENLMTISTSIEILREKEMKLVPGDLKH